MPLKRCRLTKARKEIKQQTQKTQRLSSPGLSTLSYLPEKKASYLILCVWHIRSGSSMYKLICLIPPGILLGRKETQISSLTCRNIPVDIFYH